MASKSSPRSSASPSSAASPDQDRRTYVLDTSVLLADPGALTRFAEHEVVLPSIIEGAVESLAEAGRWRIHPVGALDLLPTETAERLKAAEEATRHIDGILVNVAVG